MGMKYRDPETGQFKDLKVKTSDTLPIGTQVAYGGTVPPTGWLICDGSAVSRTTYAELFKVIGTSYGDGDGSTTFNLPNKKGRVSAGYDSTNSKFNAIGKKLGEETHTLTVEEMPSHQHGEYIDNNGSKKVFTLSDGGGSTLDGAFINTAATSYTGQQVLTTSTGGNQPHNNIQPTEVDNWIIKAFQSIGVVGKVVNTKIDSDTDTYSCNYINSVLEEHYSTEETFTGKYWIDGKKIYRKVISVSNMEISSATSISTGITNLNELISLNGIYNNISGGTKAPYPLTQNTGTILNCAYYQGNIGILGNETYSASPDRIHTFILEYTKTTE